LFLRDLYFSIFTRKKKVRGRRTGRF